MISPCEACGKSVYPTEKLRCLDRTWHKSCFKCQKCGMTLNIKNCKGYEKRPYCVAHYPKVKFTAVAETPENKRLRANTATVSKAKYQAEFQKQKGTKISVSDDAGAEQLKQAQALQSNLKYQQEYKQNMVGSKTSVANDVSSLHMKQVRHQTSQVAYHKDFENNIRGTATCTTGDIRETYVKDQQSLSGSRYHEEFLTKIRGTKTSVTDDAMGSYLKEAQAKMSNIGYRQRNVSVTKRPSLTPMVSIADDTSSSVTGADDDHAITPQDDVIHAGDRMITSDPKTVSSRPTSMTSDDIDNTSSIVIKDDHEIVHKDDVIHTGDQMIIAGSKTVSSRPTSMTSDDIDNDTRSIVVKDDHEIHHQDDVIHTGDQMITSDPKTVSSRPTAMISDDIDDDTSSIVIKDDHKIPHKNDVIHTGDQMIISDNPTSMTSDDIVINDDHEIPHKNDVIHAGDQMIISGSQPEPLVSENDSGFEESSASSWRLSLTIAESDHRHPMNIDNDKTPVDAGDANVISESHDDADDEVFTSQHDSSLDGVDSQDSRSCSFSEFGHQRDRSESDTITDTYNTSSKPTYNRRASLNVDKMEKIRRFSENISAFRTTLSYGALSRLINDD